MSQEPKRGRYKNRLTTYWIKGHGYARCNDATDDLARRGAMENPIGPEQIFPILGSEGFYLCTSLLGKIENKSYSLHQI
jgi:hypothetical protein